VKLKLWAIAIACALLSLLILWVVIEGISHRHVLNGRPWPDQELGNWLAGILALAGIAGIAGGIKTFKKRRRLGAGLIGFFFIPLILAILVFIIGP